MAFFLSLNEESGSDVREVWNGPIRAATDLLMHLSDLLVPTLISSVTDERQDFIRKRL